MPYPAKTDRQTILVAALEQLARDGLRNLSLRGLAASLNLAPNALYRYFADRAALESAIAAESARRLHRVLSDAAQHRKPVDAICEMSRAYGRFAREHRNLYDAMMTRCDLSAADAVAHEQLWSFVVGQVALVTSEPGAPEAAVALWAFLHGASALEAANAFSEAKPFTGFDFGLSAWLAAARADRKNSKTVVKPERHLAKTRPARPLTKSLRQPPQ